MSKNNIDVGHWDYADDFTGVEAASLISGLDPSILSNENRNKFHPVLIRLKKSYYEATKRLTTDSLNSIVRQINVDGRKLTISINPFKNRTPVGSELWSIEMEGLFRNFNISYDKLNIANYIDLSSDEVKSIFEPMSSEQKLVYFNKMLEQRLRNGSHMDAENAIRQLRKPFHKWASDYIHEFDEQKFSRAEINRWLSETKLTTRYKFSTTQIDNKELRSNERDTLLIIIGALCNKLDHYPMNRDTASSVARLVNALGVKMDVETIRPKLQQVPNAISNRK
ncbi:hypothetical protein [Massilia timonae]|uniref:hypothetical protein n=1 Tax=Massilia timonae TaxID=47229 RepID=UPI0028ADA9C0|nr:hypothetical protein [Massilia timonae]